MTRSTCRPEADVITVTSQYPNITTPIAIDGKNRTFDGGNATHFFQTFDAAASLSLQNMTLTKGSGSNAGAILHRAGRLSLANVRITSSKTTTGGGAAIFSEGAHLQIDESYFANNTGVRQNGSDGAGAIDHAAGDLLIDKSAFVNNAGEAAISVEVGSSSSASVKITNSTFTGNSAGMEMVAASTATLTSRLHHVTTLDSIKFGRGEHYVHNSIIWGGCTLVDGGSMQRFRKNFSQNNNCGGDMHLSGDPNLPSTPSGSDETTHFPLAPDSPAVDSVGNCRAPVDFASRDQLGVPRPQPEGGDCDAGAHELLQATPPPVASFTATKDTNNDRLWRFDASGSTGLIDNDGYAWDFGDNSSGTGVSPRHEYQNAGSFWVILTLTGPGGTGHIQAGNHHRTAGGGADGRLHLDRRPQRRHFQLVDLDRQQPRFQLGCGWRPLGRLHHARIQSTYLSHRRCGLYDVTLTVSNDRPRQQRRQPPSRIRSPRKRRRPAISRSIISRATISRATISQVRRGSSRDDGRSAAASLPVAAPKKPKPVSTCLSLPAHIVVRNITPATQCQEVSGYVIGNEAIAAAAIYAVDVWGWVPAEYAGLLRRHERQLQVHRHDAFAARGL